MRKRYMLSIFNELEGMNFANSVPISESKVKKILRIIELDIDKKHKQTRCSSVKLDQFFT